MIMKTVSINQPRTTGEDLVNDLKAAGTIVTKKSIGNTLQREGLKFVFGPMPNLLADPWSRLWHVNNTPTTISGAKYA